MNIDDKVVIIIPARYSSTRFPGKPLAPLRGPSGECKPLIEWTFSTACRVPGVDHVFVATDSERIAEVARGFGADVILTSAECRNGTERCAEALSQLEGTPRLVINVQGDAPLTPTLAVSALIERALAAPEVAVHTPALRCSLSKLERLEEDAKRGVVGATTVVSTETGRALYFSKRLIPYLPPSMRLSEIPILLHMGIYAYTAASLREYASHPEAELERLEGLEQLRFLEIGRPIAIVKVEEPAWDVWELNNESDIQIVEQGIARMLCS